MVRVDPQVHFFVFKTMGQQKTHGTSRERMSSRQRLHDTLSNMIRPMVEARGFVFWGLEYYPGEQRETVRIFVDDAGIDELAEMSRDVAVLLDVEDTVPGAYNLELSSPGIERIFFSTEQAKDYIGRAVNVFLWEPINGRRKFSGPLVEVMGDALVVDVEGETFSLPWQDIKRAKLKYDFDAFQSQADARKDPKGKDSGEKDSEEA
jgi:ribosome maturation factor RimP